MSHNEYSREVTPSKIDFGNPETAFGNKSSFELLRSYLIFRLCTVGPLVRNADTVLEMTKKMFGSTLVDAIVKRTFFKHFCGGETVEDLRPCIKLLNENRINGILDYAAENAPDDAIVTSVEDQDLEVNQPARTYDYTSEEQCDHHVEIFKTCIRAVKEVTPHGFAALKITALGNPLLLERMSTAIVESARLFERFDKSGNGKVTVSDFERTYKEIFNDAEEKLPELIPRLDSNGDGVIDYIEWSKLLRPMDLPRLIQGCVDTEGPLSKACPNPEEVELIVRIRERLFDIAECASENNVRLLIDAEQTYYQPAIDNLTISLMKIFNKSDVPVVFNTYQCYLKDAAARVDIDLDRAKRNEYHFAAKLVRGAYMVAERQRAEDMGYESPIHDTIEDTHNCYNTVTHKLITRQNVNKTGSEVMVASHNKESVEKAVGLLEELGVDKEKSGVHFAQLLGMRDDLSFNLGNSGFSAMKYVPYGKVEEVLPYLIRRAQENSDITAGMGQELVMIEKEMKRRVWIAAS